MTPKYFPNYTEQVSQLGRHQWPVPRSIELSKHFTVMHIPLDHLNVYKIYDDVSLREMIGHVMAVNNANLTFPIILDEDGEIMDGRHRVMKAIMNNSATIAAVKFETNPEPCLVLD